MDPPIRREIFVDRKPEPGSPSEVNPKVSVAAYLPAHTDCR